MVNSQVTSESSSWFLSGLDPFRIPWRRYITGQRPNLSTRLRNSLATYMTEGSSMRCGSLNRSHLLHPYLHGLYVAVELNPSFDICGYSWSVNVNYNHPISRNDSSLFYLLVCCNTRDQYESGLKYEWMIVQYSVHSIKYSTVEYFCLAKVVDLGKLWPTSCYHSSLFDRFCDLHLRQLRPTPTPKYLWPA